MNKQEEKIIAQRVGIAVTMQIDNITRVYSGVVPGFNFGTSFPKMVDGDSWKLVEFKTHDDGQFKKHKIASYALIGFENDIFCHVVFDPEDRNLTMVQEFLFMKELPREKFLIRIIPSPKIPQSPKP